MLNEYGDLKRVVRIACQSRLLILLIQVSLLYNTHIYFRYYFWSWKKKIF